MNMENGSHPSRPSAPLDPFAAFANASAQIQGALQAERERAKKLEEQLVESRRRLAETLAEDRTKIQELTGAVATLRASNGQHAEYTRELEEKVRALNSRYQVQGEELQRYRGAWSEVLQREREAKSALLRSVEHEKRADSLQSQVDQVSQILAEEQQKRERSERFAEAYQAELKHALVRIHSAESKFAELSKEHQALAQNKRLFEEEVAKVEAQIRERASWEVQRERERLRLEQERLRGEAERAALEGERVLTEERERVRSELQRTLLSELESRVGAERQALVTERARRETLEEEVSHLKSRQAQLEARLSKKIEQGVRVVGRVRSRSKQRSKRLQKERERELSGLRETAQAQVDSMERKTSEKIRRLTSEAAEKVLALESQRLAEVKELKQRAQEEQNALRAKQETRLAEQAAAHQERERQLETEMAEKVRVRDSRLYALESALDLESDRTDALTEALHTLRGQYEDALSQLLSDVNRARTLDPIRQLRKAKERELSTLRKTVSATTTRGRTLLDLANAQLEQLSEMEAAYEARLKSLEERIRSAGEATGSTSFEVPLEGAMRSGQTLDA